MDLTAIREEYSRSGFSIGDLSGNPIQQFEKWLEQALSAKLNLANAMTLAAVSSNDNSTTRTVLLKYFDQNGLFFLPITKS